MQTQLLLFEETEATEPISDIRTEVQKGRKVSYDVGEKIGGARKDEHQLKERFISEKSLASLLELENASAIFAAELVTRDQLFENFSLENERENGINHQVAYFKKLIIQRIDKAPKDTSESRQAFVHASMKILERLSNLKEVDELSPFITHTNQLLRFEGSNRDYMLQRIDKYKEELAKAKEADKEKFQKAINTVTAQLDYLSEADDCKFSALGESFRNLFTKQQSLNSTLRRIDEIKSWDDLLSPKTMAKSSSGPRKPVWERELPERPDRIGGMVSTVEKPEELMQLFNFRAVEFGHYVDDQKGREHIFRSSEALMDLADILNLSDIKSLSLDGQLALAFGARGRGNAMGHYENMYKVINFTKEKGSLGILAHEWLHALDNHLGNLSHENKNGRAVYLSELETVGPAIDSSIKNAMKELLEAISEGESVDYYPNNNKPGDRWSLTTSLKSDYERYKGDLFACMKAYKEGPMKANKSYYLRWARTDKEITKAERKVAAEFKKRAQALAWHHEQMTGERVDQIPYPSDHSEYLQSAISLDKGNKGKYWSNEKELVARAFESWVQEQLEFAGRRSDYLVCGATGNLAFPSGEERERIHRKMSELMKLVKDIL